MNHGKPVYRKDMGVPGAHVLVYFWDDRDGPNFGGWWFGPKVGGDQVWGYCANKESTLPPTTGWKVPWDGPIDAAMTITAGTGGAALASAALAARPATPTVVAPRNVPPPGTAATSVGLLGGVQVPAPAAHGVQVLPPGAQAVPVPAPQTQGVQVLPPGAQGVQVPVPGMQGVQVPAPGTAPAAAVAQGYQVPAPGTMPAADLQLLSQGTAPVPGMQVSAPAVAPAAPMAQPDPMAAVAQPAPAAQGMQVPVPAPAAQGVQVAAPAAQAPGAQAGSWDEGSWDESNWEDGSWDGGWSAPAAPAKPPQVVLPPSHRGGAPAAAAPPAPGQAPPAAPSWANGSAPQAPVDPMVELAAAWKQQEAEEAAQKQREKDLEMERRQQEFERKKAEEDAKRQEQSAALLVRKLIQRVKIATPDNFDELVAELERVQLEKCEQLGSMAVKVQQEAEKALQDSKDRVLVQREKRQAEQMRQAAEAAARQEEEDKIGSFVSQALDDLEVAKAAAAHAAETAGAVLGGCDSTEDVTTACREVEETCQLAHQSLDSTSKEITEKRNAIGTTELARKRLREDFGELYKELAKCRRQVEALREEAAERRSMAGKLAEERLQNDTFLSFDMDGDGRLNAEEVTAYAERELKLELPEDQISRIVSRFGKDGVTMQRFQELRRYLQIAAGALKP
eukprot:TRINITY_DN6924_c0_g1_i1.p1 TRINITY_DN6924_c0_g1~~TRINITY_DN6924_c0_g1_i1.p1  ORF type:complete len:736 (+),score=214.22 TRINITY_DN6924_c0_g1_i1:180-2210(+)